MFACRSSTSFFNHPLSRKAYLRLCSVEAKVKDVTIKEEISIPYKIHRGPTDILKALASTVKKDPLAPHYKYEDDPFLIPVSNVSKRSNALSKEAGKKAAQYFLETYPDIFKCHTADPDIKAFNPPVVYTENDEVSEDTLKLCLREKDVKNSLIVYNFLKERNLPCSHETQVALLELLCFYNSEEPKKIDYVEERWYSLKEKSKNTWKNNGEADKLFQEMEKDAATYAAMIQGNAKFLNVERAFTLFEELCSKEYKGTLAVYNNLLVVVPYAKQDGDMRWQFAMDIVNRMNAEGIAADLKTMNALLSIAARSRRWNKAKSMTMQILAEMKRLNIEPSLASYYHILQVFCLNSRDHQNALLQILNKIQGKEFSMRHIDDIQFFSTAMEICNKVYGSKEMAYKINDFLEIGKNSAFLGNSLNDSIYFRHFFMLLCATEDFDKFMEVYNRYIPNTYTPEPMVMLEIIQTLDFCGNYKHLPQISSDVQMFEHSEREDVLCELAKVSANAKMDEKCQKMVSDMMWQILEKLEIRAQNQMLKRLTWTGQLLGDILRIFANAKDVEKTWHVVQKLKGQEENIVGYPKSEHLLQACATFVRAKEFEKLEVCLKYTSMVCETDFKEDLIKMGEEMVKSEEIKNSHLEELKALLQIQENHQEEPDSKDHEEESQNEQIK